MDMKLEVVVLPVADVGRANDFYKELGWRLDADFTSGADFRVVQLTPPGSACSVIFGTGVTAAPPGSLDAPLLTVETVVRGVQRRSGDVEDPERMDGESAREILRRVATPPQPTLAAVS